MFKREENKNLCEDVLHEIAERQNIKITELCVMPDHIHTVVGISQTMSVSNSTSTFKRNLFWRTFQKNHIFDADTTKDVFGVQENSTAASEMQLWILYSLTLEINDSNKTFLNDCPSPILPAT